MFHHFHDEKKHIVSQGSINSDEFKQMLCFLQNNYEIVDANEWCERAINNRLKPNQICLTFDDALACQYDVAYPVLEELNIKAFWLIYTSIYTGALEKLEIYRHFRFNSFDSTEAFYDAFFKTAILKQDSIGIEIENVIKQFDPADYLQQFTFYSDSDKLFRYLRDCVLKEEKYHFIMDSMITDMGYDIEKSIHLLWITEKQILDLHNNNHIIGLHSHTHPTAMASKTYSEQMHEYKENKRILEKVTQGDIYTISYPCNSYNDDTDEIMKSLKIRLGFDAIMSGKQNNCLHFPRKDHAYVMQEMQK